MEKKMIKLKSTDGDVFETDVKYFSNSKVMQRMFQSLELDDLDNVPIPVTISSPILEKVMEWLEHYKENIMVEEVSEWDNIFLRPLALEVYPLMDAAFKFELEGLMNVIGNFLANIIEKETKENLCEVLKFPPKRKDLSKRPRSEDSISQMEENSDVSNAKKTKIFFNS